MNIDQILQAFLDDQRKRLKERTMQDYESVIDLFKIYLNDYAYMFLDDDKLEKWEAEFEENPDSDCFTRLFGADELTETNFEEFLNYFIIRKVASGESFMKTAIRVMKKFTKWLYETKQKDAEDYAAFKEYADENSKSLPNAEKLADMIYENARSNQFQSFGDDMLDGYFTVSDIKPGKLWLEEFEGGKTNIGPVIVPKTISDLCQKGWTISLVIEKKNNRWYITSSGNVYPV